MNTTTAVKTIWKIDKAHTEIQFKVKHMMVSTVTGSFNEFEGTIETEGSDFEGAEVQFSAATASIDTKNQERDTHLRSDDFFNAAKFPELTFHSRSLRKIKDGRYELIGDLTIRDHTEEVKLDVEYNGKVVDPYGQTKAGFGISGKISRRNFGLKWNAVTEAGGVVVSDVVRLDLNVQLIRQ
jgi:polyisoprenoid-binding protein YceI